MALVPYIQGKGELLPPEVVYPILVATKEKEGTEGKVGKGRVGKNMAALVFEGTLDARARAT